MAPIASSMIRCSFHLLNVCLAAVLVTVAVYHTTDNRSSTFRSVTKIRIESVIERRVDDSVNDVSVNGGRVNSVVSSCDLFSGKWVYDNKSYPLYKDRECGFMFDDLACEKYGRKDLEYQRWRWQPHGCDLPRSLSLSYTFQNLCRSEKYTCLYLCKLGFIMWPKKRMIINLYFFFLIYI